MEELSYINVAIFINRCRYNFATIFPTIGVVITPPPKTNSVRCSSYNHFNPILFCPSDIIYNKFLLLIFIIYFYYLCKKLAYKLIIMHYKHQKLKSKNFTIILI